MTTNESIIERLAFGANPSSVDRDNGIIRGVVLAEKGPFQSGRGEFDDNSLKAIARLGASAAGSGGLSSNYGHHDDLGSPDAIDSYLGRMKNVRLDGDKVRGDLHLADSAFLNPAGGTSRGEYLLARAAEDPSSFGSSLQLRADKTFRLDSRGRRMVDADGEPLAPIWTPTEILGSDIVAKGDATPGGLLSARSADWRRMTAGEKTLWLARRRWRNRKRRAAC